MNETLISSEERTIIEAKSLNLYYGDNHALKDINIEIPANRITALIGPSGCGKSTFLKTLNRMNDLIDSVKIDGEVIYNGENIYGKDVDVTRLRKQIGMVFQKPNPFPMSIYDNIAYGPRTHGIRGKAKLDHIGERCATRRYGTRSRIGSIRARSASPAASSSACA